jgi:hypothetical protein
MPYSARFYLKDPASEKPTLIFLILKFGFFEISEGRKKYRHFKYSTGERVIPSRWDKACCRIRVKSGFTGATQVNKLLDTYEDQIIRICRQAAIIGIPITPDYLRKGMDDHFCRKPSVPKGSLLQTWKTLKKTNP